MGRMMKYLAAGAVAALIGGSAQAASFDVALKGQVANFTNFQIPFNGMLFNEFSLNLTGLDSTDAITVSQGDTINATVTLDSAYTIPTSQIRTDLLLFLSGSAFPAENTGVNGTFNFYNAGMLVNSFSYDSTTSGQLASFAAVFAPNNGAFTFDSFTNDFTINTLMTSATLDGSNFTYALVSHIPEPASWAIMLMGFAGLGATLRARRNMATAAV
jgi:hypothetical protein